MVNRQAYNLLPFSYVLFKTLQDYLIRSTVGLSLLQKEVLKYLLLNYIEFLKFVNEIMMSRLKVVYI